MGFSDISNRQGMTVAILSVAIALGTGHVMQSSSNGSARAGTPAVPSAPAEAMQPLVLTTPPPPSIPKTFG